MRQIKSYDNIQEAFRALDNGGRFYNVLTKSGDGIINQSELGKVGGIFNDKQKMVLFLELSISSFDDTTKEEILSKLGKVLKVTYQKYKPQHLTPSEQNAQGQLASNAIITGIPRSIDADSDANGFIMVPIMSGQAMTFTLIPITEKYDTYEITDEHSDAPCLVAVAKGSGALPNHKVSIGGVLKELKASRDEKESSRKFLEGNYFLDLS